MLTSSVFGPFDPLDPHRLDGIFSRNIFAEPLDIRAPSDLVWRIMIDFERYPEWNPLNRFFRLDDKAEPGHTVTFGPSWGPYDQPGQGTLPEADMTTRETITVWEEGRCLTYGDLRGVFKAERSQYLEPIAGGYTRYHTFERICGVLSPLVRVLFEKRIIAGFTANGVALKARAERLAGLRLTPVRVTY